MKKIYLPLLLTSCIAFAQSGNVGINTNTPAATLDVVGQPTSNTKLDGIIAPRLTGAQLFAKNYTTAQTGALVYATAADTNLKGQTVNVTAPGYYVFDGNVWQSISTSASYQEPWNVRGTNTPATANSQNIYQTGTVSVGANNSNGMLSVYDNSGGQLRGIIYGSFKNNNLNTNPWFNIVGNMGDGTYSNLSVANDMGVVFSADNNENVYTDSGFDIIPHSGGGGATTLGLKITEQGLVGINMKHPSETFDVNGTMRLRALPINGATNAIYTAASGANSLGQTTSSVPAPTQTFTATRSVVADNNGVLGYVNGLPGSIYQTDGTLAGNRTVSYNGNNLTFAGSNTTPTSTTFSGGSTLMLTGMVYNHRELFGNSSTINVNDYTLFKWSNTGDVTFTLPNTGIQSGRTLCFSNASTAGNLIVTTGDTSGTVNYTFAPNQGKCFQFVGTERWLSF